MAEAWQRQDTASPGEVEALASFAKAMCEFRKAGIRLALWEILLPVPLRGGFSFAQQSCAPSHHVRGSLNL